MTNIFSSLSFSFYHKLPDPDFKKHLNCDYPFTSSATQSCKKWQLNDTTEFMPTESTPETGTLREQIKPFFITFHFSPQISTKPNVQMAE